MRASAALLGVSLLLPIPALAAAGADDRRDVPVRDWLVLGPVTHPLPVFHEPEVALDLEGVFGDDPFGGDTPEPVLGARRVWPDGREGSWEKAEGRGKMSQVSLEPSPGAPDGLPSLALLAAHVTVDRWCEVTLDLWGTQSQCAWMDGEPILDCFGDAKEPAEESVDLELRPGKHTLMVLTALDPRHDRRWKVAANFEVPADLGLELGVEPTRTLDMHDVVDAPTISGLALSPDGRELALLYRRTARGSSEAETFFELRRVSDGVAIETRPAPGVSDLAWSPEGTYLSWIGPAGDEKTIYLQERATGVTRSLFGPTEKLGGYLWSPGGRSLVWWAGTAPDGEDRGAKRVRGLLDRQAGHRTLQHLYLASVPDGAQRRLTAGDTSTVARDFSPDGRRLLFTRQLDDVAERPYSKTELWEVDLETLAAHKLRDFRWFNGAEYAPDGKRLLIRAQPSEFGAIGEAVPQGAVANSYDGQLFIWNPANDEVRAVTRGFDPAVSTAAWSRSGSSVVLIAAERDFRPLYRYRPGTDEFLRLATPFDVVTRFTVARDADVAAAVGTSPWEPEGLAVVDLARGRARRIPHPGDDRFRHVRRGTVESWTFTAGDGTEIDGRVYLPPGFDPSRKYPTIVYYYGGTVSVDRGFGGRYPKEWWASLGYVVYVPQPSGAIGYGQGFSAEHVNNWGRTTIDQILDGTRAFAEAHPYVDRSRMGCIGASYGGFTTMLLTTHTDIFRAAVAHAGISSIASYWGEGYWGYSYSAVASADSFPWNRADLYVEQSPLFRADRARVPILLTHGDADTNVPVGESDQFYTALKLLGKEVEYVQFDGQDHWIVAHDQRLLWSRTIMAWFDRWLKDDPAWWENLYPD